MTGHITRFNPKTNWLGEHPEKFDQAFQANTKKVQHKYHKKYQQ